VERLAAVERRAAAPLLAGAPRLRLGPGERVAGETMHGAVVAVVEEGLVATAADRAGRRRVVFVLAGPACLLAPPRADEVLLGIEDSVVVLIAEQVYGELLLLPGAADALARGLVDESRRYHDALAVFGSVSPVERVRERLAQLARAYGRVSGTGIVLDLPLTHELLAWMVGSARETVTVALARLADEGFVAREGRRYRLNVPAETL
jgi:CRP/FNR family transcriptional regulator, cyclic AMP receptor protein